MPGSPPAVLAKEVAVMELGSLPVAGGKEVAGLQVPGSLGDVTGDGVVGSSNTVE